MSIFVGLDCGGSSSRVLAVNQQGEVLFQGNSGAANLVSTPENRIRRNLQNAARDCPSPDYVCGCFAGLVSQESRKQALDLLAEIFPNSSWRAEPDYTAAYYASPPGTDVCVIAGTGSLVCSKSENAMVKSGGRGYILGDAGSGFYYGKAALVHYLDHPKSASPTLRAAIEEVFGPVDESSLVSCVYRSGTPATLLAKLAKALGTDARNGESYAIEVVDRNTGLLADTVVSHIEKHMNSKMNITICLAGGLWKGSPVFREGMERHLNTRMPDRHLVLTRIMRPPLYGAIELAKEMSIGN
jgi:N-acetylglucosamine kinase-like BadF-type ATPase